jgi:hypothetical protein
MTSPQNKAGRNRACLASNIDGIAKRALNGYAGEVAGICSVLIFFHYSSGWGVNPKTIPSARVF